jgi:hypothetical protein
VIVMMSSQADPLDAELISLTMTAVSHFREIFALSQSVNEADRIRIIFAGSGV